MKIPSLIKLITGVCLSCLATFAHGQEPESRWQLRLLGIDNSVKVEATIRFSNEPAMSCMGRGWKRVIVERKDLLAEDFFPLDSPLAYKIEHGAITLGRTHVCDRYLFLTGRSEALAIQGDYNAVGWGSRKLGSFALQKIQKP